VLGEIGAAGVVDRRNSDVYVCIWGIYMIYRKVDEEE